MGPIQIGGHVLISLDRNLEQGEIGLRLNFDMGPIQILGDVLRNKP